MAKNIPATRGRSDGSKEIYFFSQRQGDSRRKLLCRNACISSIPVILCLPRHRGDGSVRKSFLHLTWKTRQSVDSGFTFWRR